jgi:protease-4
MHRVRAVLLALAASAAVLAAEPAGTVVVPLSGDLPLRGGGWLLGPEVDTLHGATARLREAIASPEPLVVLDLADGFTAGPAACEELAAVLRERPSGRRVACLVDEVGDAPLIVAAACDEVVIASAGLAMVDGVAMDSWYAADLLKKVGITAHAVTSGPYKTAPEIFTRNGPSPEGEAELGELARSVDAALVQLSARGALDASALAAARARSPQPPGLAVELRLADKAAEPGAWRLDLPQPVRTLDGRRAVPDLSSFGGLMSFWGELLSGGRAERPATCVAVVELAGDIMPGGSSQPGETICDGDTVEMLDDLAKDDRVVAVVLRIDSPGGDAGASDRIHHAVRRLDAKKPVVALFDQVAASGGYYIGCAAREIYVHRTTITGSIGVFAIVPDLQGTADLAGLHRHVVTTGPRADLFSMTGWSPDREAAIRQIIVDVDRRFQGLVATRRGLTAEQVQALAGGRVYTGDQAIANKLADGLGHLAKAVKRARELAGHGDPLPIERLPRNQGLAARLGLAGTAVPFGLVPARLHAYGRLLSTGGPRILARGPALGQIR